MKNAILVYGIAGGLLIAALRFAEYRFVVVEHSIEIYAALIAAVFAGVGVWLGLTITRKEIVKEEVVVVKEVPAAADVPFAVDQARLRELAITPRELEILGLLAQGYERQGDGRGAVRQRKHGQDPYRPALRQARGEPAHQGRRGRPDVRSHPLI